MPFSGLIKTYATLPNFVIAVTANVLSLALVRRLSDPITPHSSSNFGLNAEYDFDWGYSVQDVSAAIGPDGVSAVGQAALLVAYLFQVIQTTTFAAASSIVITWGIEAAGKPAAALADLAEVPLVTLVFSLAESSLYTFGLLMSASDLLSLAATLSSIHSLVAAASLLITLVFTGFASSNWTVSIGRDGRQKIPNAKKD